MQPSGGVPELQKYFFFLCVCFTSEDKAYLIAFLGKKIKFGVEFQRNSSWNYGSQAWYFLSLHHPYLLLPTI